MIRSRGAIPPIVLRWLAFNTVGLAGVGIQLGMLALLRGWTGMHYILATIIAVECAVLHNFAWHDRWTWSDRNAGSLSRSLGRLARFNLSTGAVSIAGNTAIMALMVDCFSMHYIAANLIAIVLCSVINFLVSDRLVFIKGDRRVGTSAAAFPRDDPFPQIFTIEKKARDFRNC